MKLMLFSSYKKKWQFLLNIITSFVIAISILFFGLLISYFIFLPISGTPDLTFYDYLGFFFSGNWGVSSVLNPGMPVTELFDISRVCQTIEFLWVPILLGVIGGISLGRVSFKLRGKWVNRVTQFSIAIGMAFPIFFLGILLQFNSYIGGVPNSGLLLFLGGYPATGVKSAMYPDPTVITGFPIFDARLTGEVYLAIDRIEHLILPILTLTSAIIAFVAWQTRSSKERKLHEKSILSNTMKTVMIFSFIFSFYILIETTFNLRGIGKLTIDAIRMSDAYLIMGGIFLILIILVVITFISSIGYSVVKFLKFDRQEPIKIKNSPSVQYNGANLGENNPRTNSRRDFKKYFTNLKNIYKYPLLILGLIIFIVILVLAIFPEIISGYTFEEANVIDLPNSWLPPSLGHPWGTGKFGRDVFARALYGLGPILMSGFGATLIGITGGLVFGSISSLHKYVNKAIETILIVLFIIPVIVFLAPVIDIFGFNFAPTLITLIMGFLLIPIFTRAITSVPLWKRNFLISLKKIFIYIPLAIGLVIVIYEALAFLGFYSPSVTPILLGADIQEARLFLLTAPWASLWPGFMLLITVLGFFLLHYGLKNAFLDKWNSSMLIENYRQIEV